jgi:hypothetical protein
MDVDMGRNLERARGRVNRPTASEARARPSEHHHARCDPAGSFDASRSIDA